ncbi:hypothetical protein C2E20_4181 [Micractinium conductrix]|uniref:Uncharacterized protein n=1 Tax=Micractinium conductrix TaxID=554055 RepID=A0A2P6VER9_9CHLO|nr:hypothetical protein C2E20_4181 [Micractinium conductrix]|eukprot:PSC72590.1 hypothetical protein C2E20_4181 [Micractinium conductrix]
MFILAGAHYSGLRTEPVSKKWAPTDLAAASLRNITVTATHLAKVVAAPVTAKNPSKKEYKDWIADLPAAVRAWADQKGILAPPAKLADRGLAMKRIHGYYTVANKTGAFDRAKASAVAVGRSIGGKTAGTSAVANKTGMFNPARIQAAKNCRASADPRHCHRVLIVDKQGTVVHFVDVIGAGSYQSKSAAAKQCLKGGTAMKFRQTGVPSRVCWPAYLEPAPVSSELVDGLRAIMGIYEAGPPPQRIRI